MVHVMVARRKLRTREGGTGRHCECVETTVCLILHESILPPYLRHFMYPHPVCGPFLVYTQGMASSMMSSAVILLLREYGTKVAKLLFGQVWIFLTHECDEGLIHAQHHHHFHLRYKDMAFSCSCSRPALRSGPQRLWWRTLPSRLPALQNMV